MAEREMNRHQRGMVDGCFEEGHYQRGIATLNQLRMENLRPSPEHIRQLVYISLYPPPPSKDPTKETARRKESTTVSGSPSKQIQQARRMQKQALFPPPEATQAAKELLGQYAMDSITPEALLRAVPCYPPTKNELDGAPRLVNADMFFGNHRPAEDMDSYIAKQASRLKECKDCWSTLRKGIVTRQDAALTKKGDPFLDTDLEDENDTDKLSSAVIGKHSWHLLEWFILLFEKDQALVEKSENAIDECYSILLLSQIKPASREGDPRSHVDCAMDIVFICYNELDQWRRNLGRRLMTLLVALARCRHFSPTQLIDAISIRFHATARDVLADFMGDLPPTLLGFSIKLAVCDRLLTQSINASNRPNVDGGARARPQARRVRPGSVHLNKEDGSLSRSQSLAQSQTTHYQWKLPSSQSILQLLERTPSSPSATLSNLLILFHMIISFGSLRVDKGKDADQTWMDAILTGGLGERISETFSDEKLSESDRRTVKPMRLILLSKCNSWKQSFA